MYDGIARKSAPYLFLGQTTSLCETCLGLVPAKIVEERRRHLLLQALRRARRAEDAGVRRSGLLAPHAGVSQARRPAAGAFQPAPNAAARTIAASAPTTSSIPAWRIDRDQRGLQPDLPGVLRRTPRRARTRHRSLAEVERMLDALVASEGEPDLVQISGGEPTIHPQIFEILDGRAAPPDPPRHAQHQRHPHRRGAGFRATRWPSCKRGLRGLSAVRFAERRGAEEPARRGLCAHPPAGAGESRGAQHLDDAGLHREARRQRRRDRRHRAPCAQLQVRARRHLPAGAGCRPQRRLRSQDTNRIVLSEIRRRIVEDSACSPTAT